MIFIDPDCAGASLSSYPEPEFLKEVESAGIPGGTLALIKEYVRESELSKIELAQCKSELDEFRTALIEAQKLYNENPKKRNDKRNKEVIQFLGFSEGSGRRQIIDRKSVYINYIRLVRKEGLCRYEAVKKISERYLIKTEDAAIAILFDCHKAVIDKWRKYDASFPTIEKILKGLVPPRLKK
jgi:hypothetical protein